MKNKKEKDFLGIPKDCPKLWKDRYNALQKAYNEYFDVMPVPFPPKSYYFLPTTDTSEIKKKFIVGLDEVFEDRKSYTGVMSSEDYLFESVLSFTWNFFEPYLKGTK
jgi:hypothetical protein